MFLNPAKVKAQCYDERKRKFETYLADIYSAGLVDFSVLILLSTLETQNKSFRATNDDKETEYIVQNIPYASLLVHLKDFLDQ